MVKDSQGFVPRNQNPAKHGIACEAEGSTPDTLWNGGKWVRMREQGISHTRVHSVVYRPISGQVGKQMQRTQPATHTTAPIPTHHPTTTPSPPHPTHPHPSLYTTPHTPVRVAPMPHKEMDTQYTHHRHKWGIGGHMMCSPQGGLSAGKGRLKFGLCPRRGSDPASGQWTSWGPKAGVPHRWYEVSTWTPLASGESSCPPPCGTDTEQ